MNNNSREIKKAFIKNYEHYYQIQGDSYVASQMAATATRSEYNLTKNELINLLNK